MKLTQRQINELKFHDKWAKQISVEKTFYRETFESPSALENHYILSQMDDLSNKKILDLGCGIGDATIYLALKGAQVTSIDVSPRMIDFVRKSAKYYRVNNKVKALTMPAETLCFKGNSFDYVYGNGILHHIDFMKAAPQIYKVLKKNGKAFFIEPLSYNPIIHIYRKIAKKVRTVDEKPLSFKDIKKFGTHFTKYSHREFHLNTLLVFLWFFIGKGTNPNKERYWKKILLEGDNYNSIIKLLSRLDNFILKYLSFLNRFCWITVIIVEK